MLSEPPPPPDCTVTVVLCVAGVVPLAPSQVRVNVVVVLSAPVLALPLIPLLPDQPPEAVQLLALLADQLSVEADPLLTAPGLALIETAGAAGPAGGTSCPVAVRAWEVSPPPQPGSAAASAEHSARRMMPRASGFDEGAAIIMAPAGNPAI